MSKNGLFTQIIMLIVAVSIVFVYIQPEFEKIEVVRGTIKEYVEQKATVIAVNSTLSDYVSRMDSLSAKEQEDLRNYLPDKIDNVSLLRDIYIMTKEAGVTYIDSEYEGAGRKRSKSSNVKVTEVTPLSRKIELSVEGEYEDIKTMLSLIEQNHYPLEITDLSISKSEEGILSVDMSLTTYSYRSQDKAKNI